MSYYVPNQRESTSSWMDSRCLSNRTIENMRRGGASDKDIQFAVDTQWSTDARDVARHREYIVDYNPGDPWREPNNFILHPASYEFGSGRRSEQFIGDMFSQLPAPVVIHGPAFALHPALAPHVVFTYR